MLFWSKFILDTSLLRQWIKLEKLALKELLKSGRYLFFSVQSITEICFPVKKKSLLEDIYISV